MVLGSGPGVAERYAPVFPITPWSRSIPLPSKNTTFVCSLMIHRSAIFFRKPPDPPPLPLTKNPDVISRLFLGLDNAMYRYMESFSNNHVDGEKLLQMRSSSLEEELGIYCIGHQEIILEAVEHLRNFVSL